MKVVLVFLIIIASFATCRKAKNCMDPKLDCSSIRCFTFISLFEFKLIDKNTGEDLVFGPNPKYTINDIKLFTDASRTSSLSLTADNNRKILQTIFARDNMVLEIKGADVYNLSTEFRVVDCCSNRVKSLMLDNTLICSCCDETIPVRIK